MFGKIGRITSASSGTNPLRANNLGGLIVEGSYADRTLGGQQFFATALDMEVALYTATSAIGLIIYNPPGSGVNLLFNKWSVQVYATSATMTGMVLAISAQTTTPTTTTAAPLWGKTLLTGSTGLVGGQALAYSIATIAVAPVLAWPLFHNTAAINTVGAEVIGGDLEDSIGAAPGTVTIMGALGAAGVNVNLGLMWKEVPVGL
jgi:hypothetical protein